MAGGHGRIRQFMEMAPEADKLFFSGLFIDVIDGSTNEWVLSKPKWIGG